MKIAMWSGPRNLSTAMMYSFGSRADLSVIDEPFYAAYLAATRLDHPMRDEVLREGDTDPQSVARTIAALRQPYFLKLMVFHMLESFPMTWADDCVHVHLIRHPARVIASYALKRQQPSMQDIGVLQQWEMYQRYPGPVINSHDIRQHPERMLRCLCASIGLPFDVQMLQWQKGPKPFDGVWAPHWYDSVHRSTGFAGPEDSLPVLHDELHLLQTSAMAAYNELFVRRLQA